MYHINLCRDACSPIYLCSFCSFFRVSHLEPKVAILIKKFCICDSCEMCLTTDSFYILEVIKFHFEGICSTFFSSMCHPHCLWPTALAGIAHYLCWLWAETKQCTSGSWSPLDHNQHHRWGWGDGMMREICLPVCS